MIPIQNTSETTLCITGRTLNLQRVSTGPTRGESKTSESLTKKSESLTDSTRGESAHCELLEPWQINLAHESLEPGMGVYAQGPVDPLKSQARFNDVLEEFVDE